MEQLVLGLLMLETLKHLLLVFVLIHGLDQDVNGMQLNSQEHQQLDQVSSWFLFLDLLLVSSNLIKFQEAS